jgi:hypothetical protein
MFEHGTVVMDLMVANNRNDLANAAIIELTGLSAGGVTACALPVSGGAWVCRWPHTHSKVWMHVTGVSNATRALNAARSRIDEDRGGLKIIYICQ